MIQNLKFKNITHLIILVLSTATLYFSWKYQNFGLLGLFLCFFLLFIYFRIKKRKNILLFLLSFTFMTSIVEILIPFILIDERYETYFDLSSDYSNNYFKKVDGIGYLINSGSHTSKKLTKNGDTIYDVTYNIGVDGYREELKSLNFDGYIFGGSFAFGEGLNDNQTISYYLNQHKSLKIKNYGIHGFGMHQALFNLQNEINNKNEKIVILLTSPFHASRSSCKHNLGGPSYKVTSNGLKLIGLCKTKNFIEKVLWRSNIFKKIESAYMRKLINKNDMDLYLAIIENIFFETQKTGSKLLIAYIDGYDKDWKDSEWNDGMTTEYLKKISDGFVDVTLAKRVENLEKKYYLHEFDKHPSALANFERAKLISIAISNLKK